MGTLSFEPLLPPALWLTLAAAGLVLLVYYGWSRPPSVPKRRWAWILTLMGAAMMLVLGILLNPTWVEPVVPPAGKPLLTVLVDATASMATADGPDGQTRYQAAAKLARACAGDLGDRFDVRVLTFAGSVSPAEANDPAAHPPEGQVTDLAAALTESLEENRPQGQTILLVSDGIHNAGGGTPRVLDAVRVAKAMACPIYTYTLGGDAVVQDLAVEFRSPQELAYIGQKVPVTVLLRQRGLTGGQAKLALVHEGKEIERQQIPLSNQETTEVRFHVKQDKTGLYRYEVRAEPLPGEVSLVNNTAVFLLRVVDEPIRVLLLEGKPYWDAKFLMRTLLADPSIDLDSLVRVGDNRLHRRTLKRAGTVAAPDKPEPPKKMDPPGKGDALPPKPIKTTVKEDWKILSGFSEVLTNVDGLRSYQIVVLGRDANGT